MKQDYIETVRLLIDIAPDIFESPRFAMKGGTALNLFLQDMPRLSVDIDVVFVDHTLGRDDALQAITSDLHDACVRLEQRGYDVAIPKRPGGEDVTLFVRYDLAEVKVEVNPIFRGALLAVEKVSLAPAAQTLFTADITVPMLSRAEVYGGKLVAAMDRQHPRDIFDVLKMYETFGLEANFAVTGYQALPETLSSLLWSAAQSVATNSWCAPASRHAFAYQPGQHVPLQSPTTASPFPEQYAQSS